METWKKIVLGSGLLLVGGYIAGSLVYFRHRRTQPTCQQLVIDISDSRERQYVTAEEIQALIQREQKDPMGQELSADQFRQIEQTAKSNQLISSATCYSLSNGDVKLRLKQRQPKFRVIGEDNYFVDTNREKMPVRSTTATCVPIVTGHVTQEMAKTQIWDLVDWLEGDDFWSAQVEQIDVDENNEIRLVPRVGSGTILLGQIDRYEQKLDKLKRLYRKGFSRFGWKEYREIDLRFRGQIVCR